MAQQQELCICYADSCDVFEMRHLGDINLTNGFISVDSLHNYSMQRVDSIVFVRPRLAATELGWWGDLDGGASRYEARFYDVQLHFTYHVTYRLTALDGLCREAACTITFCSKEQRDEYAQSYLTNVSSDVNGDPYIYVKETLTGPRKFEQWVMSGPQLPTDALLASGGFEQTPDSSAIVVQLTSLLAGRPMSDVRQIIEGWIYNPLVKADNPNYDPDK